MKTLIISLFIFLIVIDFSKAQTTLPDSTKALHNNCIGLDATALFRTFFSLSTGSSIGSNYMFSYRRFLKSNAIRFSIGVEIRNSKSVINDSLSNKQVYSKINAAIGFEHYTYISKRFNFYFGLDLIFSYRNDNYKTFTTTTTWYEQSGKSTGYGFSPLAGIQFKLNKRLSVATEASYDLLFQKGKSTRTSFPPTQSDNHTDQTAIDNTYHAAGTIILRYLF